MSTFSIFLVLITIVCFLLIIVIMVQNPKGGGLSSSLGGSQLGGVQKTTDFLDKSTWTLATILIVLILLSSLSFTGAMNDNSSKIIDQTETGATKAVTPAAKPAATAAPTTEAPAEGTPVEAAPEKK